MKKLIKITYDRDMLCQIEKKLGKMRSEAPKALKNALNQTARQARTELKEQVRKQYTVKAGKVSQAMKIQRATNSSLDATIFVKGKALNITNYKTTAPKKGAKAQILKKGGLKKLAGPQEITAFKGLNDLIWQRRGKERYPIKPLKSLSIPKAVIGNKKRVYRIVKPKIKRNLQENVEKQVKRILKKE